MGAFEKEGRAHLPDAFNYIRISSDCQADH